MTQAAKTLPKLSSVDLQIVLYDLYETIYGIYNHVSNNRNRPLASVAFHDSEDFTTGSLLEGSMKNYIEKNIGEFFKISYLEFMELPRDVIELMFEVAGREIKKRTAIANNIQSELSDT